MWVTRPRSGVVHRVHANPNPEALGCAAVAVAVHSFGAAACIASWGIVWCAVAVHHINLWYISINITSSMSLYSPMCLPRSLRVHVTQCFALGKQVSRGCISQSHGSVATDEVPVRPGLSPSSPAA